MIATVYVTKNFGFRRGEIYFADLDPHYGSEQGGKRPVIVIQNNTGNKFAPTVIVAAVTSKVSKKPNQPTHVLIEQNPAFSRPSVVLLEQIFTIDKERIQRLLGQTTPDEMYQINEALMNSLDLNGGRSSPSPSILKPPSVTGKPTRCPTSSAVQRGPI